MKKLALYFSAFLLAGCTVSEIGDGPVSSSSNDQVYTAGFENVDTRVYLDEELRTHWTEDDRISIFTSTTNAEYRFDGATGDREGSFSVVDGTSHPGGQIPTVYAVYPYSNGTSISSSGLITLNLPETQYFARNSYGLGANTMLAVGESSSSSNLLFKNLCGYIVVRLYGEAVVKSITLTGNNGEKLAGQATVTAVYGEDPVVEMSENAATSITLDCGDGVALSKAEENATSFWFVVPPITFSRGFTIRVEGSGQCAMEKGTSMERTVSRNVKHALAPLECDFSVEEEGIIEFADTRFKAYCVENFDTNGDGEISFSEAKAVTTIECCERNIRSLEGIKFFSSLTYLDCRMNRLRSLDLSDHTAIEQLVCFGNDLKSLDVSGCTSLTEMEGWSAETANFSGCTSLKSIGSIPWGVITANLSECTALTDLSCNSNQLTSLDVSGCTALSELLLFPHSHGSLTDLDVSGCTALVYLWCCDSQLASIDISECSSLTALMCYDNQLSSLDVSNNQTLTSLWCYDNQLSSLDVSNNTELTELICGSNQLTSLDVSKTIELTYLECGDNQLASLDISNNDIMENLYCYSNKLTSIDVSKNTYLVKLSCHDNLLKCLDVSECSDLYQLYCYSNPYLTEIWLKTGQSIASFSYDTGIATVYYK